MNIHFADLQLYNDLINASLYGGFIGSRMYGTADEFSDFDILHIYSPSEQEKISHLFSHHQLQYKEVATDHVFISFYNFIRNTLNGDSTINFELLNSSELENSILKDLYYYRKIFFNYKIIRSYLGFAKRDVKHVVNETTERDKNKKLFHAKRSLEFAKIILSDILNDSCNFNPIFQKDLLLDYSQYMSFTFEDRKIISRLLNEEIDSERSNVNNLLDKKQIPFYMKVEDQKFLDDIILVITNSNFYKKSKLKNIDMSLFYNAEENRIIY